MLWELLKLLWKAAGFGTPPTCPARHPAPQKCELWAGERWHSWNSPRWGWLADLVTAGCCGCELCRK